MYWPTKDRYGSLIILLAFLLCIPIFLFDITTPQGAPDPILYIFPIILVAYFSRKPPHLLILGILSLVLTAVGFVLSPASGRMYTLADFTFTIFALIASTVLGYYIVKQTVELDRANEKLTVYNEQLEGTRKELEAANIQLIENNQAMNRSNQDLDNFAHVVSHDLKSPLRSISTLLQLLQKKYRGKTLDQKADEYIDQAVHSSIRMAELIDDLLQYSRIDGGDAKHEPTNMNAVLDQVRESLAETIREQHADVSNDLLPTIMANRSQMLQVLQNLVANALKFHGQDTPVVHLSAVRINKEWRLSVRDNGIGIDPQYGDKLFKPFSRLHSQEEYEGTGIGLATVKKIIERNGGNIWFESEVGKGTTFFFTIPDDKINQMDQTYRGSGGSSLSPGE